MTTQTLTQKPASNRLSTQDDKRLLSSKIKKGMPLYRYKGLKESSMEDIYSCAYNLYTSKKYEQALNLFRGMAVYNHIDKRVWMGIGACNQILQQYNKAIAAYFYATLLDADDPLPLFYSVECHLALKNYPQALAALEVIKHILEEKPECKVSRERAEEMRGMIEQGMQENHKK
ncbi:MAG: CesD/SycD/LcrH family type III secretion system chaperone [Verrucomicrobia bacterium RIFCSPHIGHO2_12_FULL_41_10]|nr:MAG: CesD/SycD/LcrH family type III secretion system chaperone [Verrucomicrobia bacterium RIFCSPHIGHO2_12_FULL_41_10]HLB33874.1 SycD/LcrH family type III secretion system chaperone [Chthoniobacterales bacterium]